MQLTPVLSAHWDEPDSWTLAAYERHGGYAAFPSMALFDGALHICPWCFYGWTR